MSRQSLWGIRRRLMDFSFSASSLGYGRTSDRTRNGSRNEKYNKLVKIDYCISWKAPYFCSSPTFLSTWYTLFILDPVDISKESPWRTSMPSGNWSRDNASHLPGIPLFPYFTLFVIPRNSRALMEYVHAAISHCILFIRCYWGFPEVVQRKGCKANLGRQLLQSDKDTTKFLPVFPEISDVKPFWYARRKWNRLTS